MNAQVDLDKTAPQTIFKLLGERFKTTDFSSDEGILTQIEILFAYMLHGASNGMFVDNIHSVTSQLPDVDMLLSDMGLAGNLDELEAQNYPEEVVKTVEAFGGILRMYCDADIGSCDNADIGRIVYLMYKEFANPCFTGTYAVEGGLTMFANDPFVWDLLNYFHTVAATTHVAMFYPEPSNDLISQLVSKHI